MEPENATSNEKYYFEGVKQGIDIALSQIRRIADISKAKAMLEELESGDSKISVAMPTLDTGVSASTKATSATKQDSSYSTSQP